MRNSYRLLPLCGLLWAGSIQAERPLILCRPDDDGQWHITVDGRSLPLRGAGGAVEPGLLEALQAAGGNVVRTWGIETLAHTYANGETYLDRAHRLGLMVVPGIWVQHERHGFDYSDPDFIAQQREAIRGDVRRYKDHPAILAWGLGNEMEGPSNPAGSVPVFKELEELIRIVKEEDPSRPVMSVIAYHPDKIPSMIRHVPSLDILGINSYGAAAGVGAGLKAAGWDKPFALTEFGVLGFWEVPTTGWGAPLEPNSHEKARTYFATHRMVTELNEGAELCLGTFPFLWGWKQERTATWFGMFLPTGEKLGSVDAMTRLWTGDWPANRCPRIDKVESETYAATIAPDTPFTAHAVVTDPEDDALRYEWLIKAESTAASEGGDAEYVPPAYPALTLANNAATGRFISPSAPGPYRVFLTVYDGQGNAATANFPFLVAVP
jgi:hypothetical protein